MNSILTINSILGLAVSRVEKARQLAEVIRTLRNYRWVGIYDVGPEMVSVIAFSGPGAPAFPRFPVADGLTGAAIRERKTVVAGDVHSDTRYLTAFASTRSEIIVPVLDESTGAVIGTIDIESEKADAFSAEEQKLLEECAIAVRGCGTRVKLLSGKC